LSVALFQQPVSPVRHIRVAVPVPALEALTYRLPESSIDPVVGARVLVPLGKRIVTGVVTGPTPAEAEDNGIKTIVDVLDGEAFLPPEIVTLALWVADYYACGAGEAIGAAMPPRAWIESERHARITDAGHARMLLERGARREILEQLATEKPQRVDALIGEGRGTHGAVVGLERDGLLTITRPLVGTASAFRTMRVAHLTAQGHEAVPADPPTLTARQQEAVLLLAAATDGIVTSELGRRGITPAMLKRLSALGLVTFTRRRVERDPAEHASAASDRPAVVELTAEQRAAFDRLTRLAQSGSFATVLLHGVTGSGKTELYLRLAREVAAAGRGVIVLVPEIALTPAVAGSFRALFGDRVAIQHSGLSDGERHDQWHRIRRAEIDVVVGTRSAVFAPVQRLGLIIVDEEHDGSYKQEESPRYNGRDVAVMRARANGALAVLGSATPSLESFYNAQNGRYELITLEKRVLDRPMAAVTIVDMRQEYADAGPDVIVSRPLAAAIEERLGRREQAMVLLNRRGFATSVFCRQCGQTLDCPNCSVTLTVHKAARRARCHYCNYAVRIPSACVHCSGQYLEHVGFGTERVEHEIAARFPDARVARVDRDTIRRRGAIGALLRRFAAGEIDVLVGTQMIAKGHDFPQVTLVGVVSADVGLGLADFRAAERTFQLLTQVAGRAGRGEIAGEAIVQTIHPAHYSIRHACRQDYRAFYQDEIGYRQSMRYPPVRAMINAVVKAPTLEAALGDAAEVINALRPGGEPYKVLGPAPAPLSRLKGEHRAQFFVKGTQRAAMRKALLAALEARPDIRRRTTVDVDPMSVL
jgi:primosomal protein N' (replication factor Y) (superfamily II helicase)